MMKKEGGWAEYSERGEERENVENERSKRSLVIS